MKCTCFFKSKGDFRILSEKYVFQGQASQITKDDERSGLEVGKATQSSNRPKALQLLFEVGLSMPNWC